MVKRTARRRHSRRGGNFFGTTTEDTPAAPAASETPAKPAVQPESGESTVGSFLSKFNPFKKSDTPASTTAGRRRGSRKSRGARRTRKHRGSRKH